MANKWIITAFILAAAGMVNAIKDKSALNQLKLPWWNKEESWKRKWKIRKYGASAVRISVKKPWYYLGLYKPKYIERFPYSSTIFVFLTDGWHLMQFIQFKLLFTALMYHTFDVWYEILLGVMVCSTIFSLSFTLVYDLILKRKRNE